MLDRLREFHRRTGASHFASSASVLPILVEIKGLMKDGDVCLLSKAHGITAYNLVFGVPMDAAPVQGEFGSLGSGLAFAVGVAKVRPGSTVYVVVGDGELQEGSCLEALMAAERLGIENLVVYVDWNGMQGMGDCAYPEWVLPPMIWRKTVKGDRWECHYDNA